MQTIGLSLRNQCPKGRNCSFLHIFRNPFGQYSIHRTLWLSANATKSQRSDFEKQDRDR